jgi:catalase
MELPDALPRVLETPAQPEVTVSPALSLTARPGETGVRTRKVAILVADGVEGDSLTALHAALTDAGAVPRFVGPRLGTFKTAGGDVIEADASMENSPPVLFDALVLPDGKKGVSALAADGHTTEFVMNQYRHCKTILAFGASSALLERAGVSATLSDGSGDTGVLVLRAGEKRAAEKFMTALAMDRHRERESDPPMI